jgi:cytochrome c556
VTPVERRERLRELLGELIIDLDELDSQAARQDRGKVAAMYEQVRTRCESCHEEFRWTKKQRGR